MQNSVSRFFSLRRVVLLTVAMSALGFASDGIAADNHPIEYLDETTGATITTVSRPLIFIRDDGSGAVDRGAEYITLAPARIDRGGRIQYVLVAYLWSVGAGIRATATSAEGLWILAGDQTLALQSAGRSASDFGIHQSIHPPPLGEASPYFYIVDIATFRTISSSPKVNLQLPGTPSRTYTIFDDRFRAFAEFVHAVSALDE